MSRPWRTLSDLPDILPNLSVWVQHGQGRGGGERVSLKVKAAYAAAGHPLDIRNSGELRWREIAKLWSPEGGEGIRLLFAGGPRDLPGMVLAFLLRVRFSVYLQVPYAKALHWGDFGHALVVGAFLLACRWLPERVFGNSSGVWSGRHDVVLPLLDEDLTAPPVPAPRALGEDGFRVITAFRLARERGRGSKDLGVFLRFLKEVSAHNRSRNRKILVTHYGDVDEAHRSSLAPFHSILTLGGYRSDWVEQPCDAYVFFSRYEGFGLAPWEASRQGRPVFVNEGFPLELLECSKGIYPIFTGDPHFAILPQIMPFDEASNPFGMGETFTHSMGDGGHPIEVYSDLFDPGLGSEFSVPKALLSRLLRHGSARVTTFQRMDNVPRILAWGERQGGALTVQSRLLRWADAKGHHRSRLLWFLEVALGQMRFLRATSLKTPVVKSGMVHALFNLLFLLRRGPTLIGPVSGFEAFPLRLAWSRLSWGGRAYYAGFNGMTWSLRKVFRFLWKQRPKVRVLCATQKDMALICAGDPELEARCAHLPEVSLEGFEGAPSPTPPSGGAIITWCGAMIPRKNPGLALEVAIALLKRNPDLRFRFVGTGPLAEEMRSRILEEPALTPRLEWLGEVPREEMRRIFDESALLLMTSWREVNSYVAMEALARGVPIVAPPFSGHGVLSALFGCVVPVGGGENDIHRYVGIILNILQNLRYYNQKAACFSSSKHNQSNWNLPNESMHSVEISAS